MNPLFYIIIIYTTLINLVVFYSYFFPQKKREKKQTYKPFVSVIVAVRNEEKNLKDLLEKLSDQLYDENKFEVIIVDDYSEDNSKQIINDFKKQFPQLKSLMNKFNPGKKNALKTGIEIAQGEIILLTDSDCLPPRSWINSIVDVYDEHSQLVIGYSPFLEDGKFVTKFCRYENFLTSFLLTVFYRVGFPYMGFGRNLSFKKQFFKSVKGYDGIDKSLSGDDDLFIQKAMKSGGKIILADSPDSIVHTKCDLNIKILINQKTRHISASKFYPIEMKISLGFFYLSNIFLNIILIPSLISLDLFIISFIILNYIIKIFEISLITKRMNEKFTIYLIPLFDFIYSILLIITGILSRKKIVRWK